VICYMHRYCSNAMALRPAFIPAVVAELVDALA
jgi:hypothetical protein